MDSFPNHPLDLSLQLPRDTFHQVIHTLCAALPPPVSDSPEDLIRRDNDAIARVASMLPANADEAHLAVQCVAAQVMALDCSRLARRHDLDTAPVLKCHTMSLAMMRQASAARRLLLRVQAIRQKREANNATLDQAAWTEHAAMGLMANALGRTPPAPIAQPQPTREPEPEAEPIADLAAEAEQYAIIHPRRAALIRAAGGLPANCDFGPPPPELLPLIVNGATPNLRALDDPTKASAAATP